MLVNVFVFGLFLSSALAGGKGGGCQNIVKYIPKVHTKFNYVTYYDTVYNSKYLPTPVNELILKTEYYDQVVHETIPKYVHTTKYSPKYIHETKYKTEYKTIYGTQYVPQYQTKTDYKPKYITNTHWHTYTAVVPRYHTYCAPHAGGGY